MMIILRFIVLIILIFSTGHSRPIPEVPLFKKLKNARANEIRGALVATRFKSLEELKSVVQIEHFNTEKRPDRKPFVRLTHHSEGLKVISVIEAGISEKDINKAKEGGFLKRVTLGLKSPYTAINRHDLMRIFLLGRRIGKKFGEGDVAFYDFAETILDHINDEHFVQISPEDLSEKGYLNTFNHITAQVFMTSLFSEKLADFAADVHERSNMPEIVVGNFKEEQIYDLETGPVDNFTDVINNEWGQELGKVLKEKYNINRNTIWTPALLTDFLNDIQRYFSWAFQISFRPFRVTDELVIKYAIKINRVMNEASLLKPGK